MDCLPIDCPVYKDQKYFGKIASVPFLATPNKPDEWFYLVDLRTYGVLDDYLIDGLVIRTVVIPETWLKLYNVFKGGFAELVPA
jgi:hypothetical protein